jgi:hypothetical protein
VEALKKRMGETGLEGIEVNSERTGLLNLRVLDGFKYIPCDDSRKGNRKPAVQVARMRFKITKHCS